MFRVPWELEEDHLINIGEVRKAESLQLAVKDMRGEGCYCVRLHRGGKKC